eukprot:Blabericola_migrator_1__3538@NODE_204_length_11434_cov_295_698249_g175_i0_p5_GENE_NODE_204_length_11434_cov_295_698249_g175_i0NODE_204_length_11434_cov_295_698249_g175_i0_p5_ORF_typecomplete_len307_score34_62Chromo/PF00385_24/6_6e07FAP/PF07174_11/0_18KAR9/PF08580_10/0_35_NODE_204_length_11434_cov_295_698249_g175_i055196439
MDRDRILYSLKQYYKACNDFLSSVEVIQDPDNDNILLERVSKLKQMLEVIEKPLVKKFMKRVRVDDVDFECPKPRITRHEVQPIRITVFEDSAESDFEEAGDRQGVSNLSSLTSSPRVGACGTYPETRPSSGAPGRPTEVHQNGCAHKALSGQESAVSIGAQPTEHVTQVLAQASTQGVLPTQNSTERPPQAQPPIQVQPLTRAPPSEQTQPPPRAQPHTQAQPPEQTQSPTQTPPEEYYIIEQIRGYDEVGGLYYVKWKNYDECTWEPRQVIDEGDAWDLVEDYKRRWNKRHPRNKYYDAYAGAT